jgi:hypothetical protein
MRITGMKVERFQFAVGCAQFAAGRLFPICVATACCQLKTGHWLTANC